jgi:hypothetical protein
MMLTHEGSHPEYFGELCALAASGQISESELIELQDHMQDCAHCRSTYAQFIDLLHDKLPLIDPELRRSTTLASFFSENSSYRKRFLTRARQQGLAIPSGHLRNTFGSEVGSWLLPRLCYTQIATLAIVLLLATVGILSYTLRQSNARYRTLAANLAAMSRQISRLDRPERGPEWEIRSGSQSAPNTPLAPVVAAPSGADPELVKARQDYATAEARAGALREQLQGSGLELQALGAQLEDAVDSRNQLAKKLAETAQAVTRASDELQRLNRSHSEDTARIATQGMEIRQLSEKLSAQTETLERERTLLAAGRDIHDLMGARNLHIVDVLDVDSKGKDQRAVGRVFYTEGKSLIFYAFDLGNRVTAKRNASFQVWGASGPAQSPAKSLGIFYVDDQRQNRWVLKFDDPDVLTEIDSVFVTVEPPGGSTKPTGQKLLYAYLKTNLNHP